ncbi:transferrin receptor protein 2 [Discoglossus pictus]
MDTVRELFRGAVPSSNSYSIYRGVEDQDGAELYIEEPDKEEPSPKQNDKAFYQRISPQCKRIIIGITLTAVVAFILGFVVTRKSCTICEEAGAGPVQGDYEPSRDDEPNRLDWNDLSLMFSKYLKDGQQLQNNIRRVATKPHPAGSDEDKDLAMYVLQNFKSFSLHNTWVDSHFAELQYPDSNKPNFLRIVDSENNTVKIINLNDQDLYCPYSAPGNVTAGLIYANYGRKEDFERLEKLLASPRGHLVIVRTGLISFAEKVSNAELAGALGVLIFPDINEDLGVYGHVHLGTGDPNTPGFPSFNHTQFPPFKSSGLPGIPAQPISTGAAQALLRLLSNTIQAPPADWSGNYFGLTGLGPKFQESTHQLNLVVQNVPRNVELINVFGSITGKIEPEHYIVVGAQRDSWGPGAAKSGVGTAILLELARSISMMVLNGFQPRRSLVFVSWDAGDFGNVGATEWLEGYLSMLHLKAAAYMSVDTAVLGHEQFIAKTSPLFKSLIENMIKQVDNPRRSQESIYNSIVSQNQKWENEVITPLSMDSAAFAFTAFGGVPAIEFSFVQRSQKYTYLDTKKDIYEELNSLVGGRLPAVTLSVAEVAGLALVKLSHDHILPLDYSAYSEVLLQQLMELNKYYSILKSHKLTLQWLSSARGDYMRATQSLKKAISQSDLRNEKVLQAFNVRIMRVEFYFLSQYVSAVEFPYRHILIGKGNHTFRALLENVSVGPDKIDENLLRKQIAFITWTIKGAANALSGEVWQIKANF